jgi:hypothetical protein
MPMLTSFLSPKFGDSKWQQAFLGDFELSSVDVPPTVSPTPVFREVSAGGGHAGGSKGEAGTGAINVGGDSRGS